MTEEPSAQRLVIAGAESLGEEGFRGLVATVAEHKGVARDEVLLSMLVKPKWVAEERERGGVEAGGGREAVAPATLASGGGSALATLIRNHSAESLTDCVLESQWRSWWR